ncbi:non-homologous end-joining factor 1-like [Phlebotomus argentipes]|uniref:non-homologous end-joining factor 1-like n=1 Tax=Phlebotomus argentipes TaxID=94469 RepID=UPI00289338DA|nr:non-homologous end-joining factor 1-like [Phlebotomus argentipes]
MDDFRKNEWNLVEISGDEKQQMIKYVVNDESVTCLVCDMISMKSESVSRTELFARAKLKNTNLQLENEKILNLITKTKASEYKLEENSILNVKYYISRYPYRFSWNLSQSNTEEFMKFFTAPLLCSLKTSEARIEQLQDLLKRKDEEIAGYKLSGATLVRKHLETSPFDPDAFDGANDFSFVGNHSIAEIYGFCGVSQIPVAVTEDKSPKAAKAPSTATSPSGSKISPARRSRMMQNLKRLHDDKVLYDEEGSSQETSTDDCIAPSEAETQATNPKIRKRLNL